MKTFNYFINFHKDYAFYPRDWIIPVCFEPVESLSFPYLMLSAQQPNISELFRSVPSLAGIADDVRQVGYYTQTVAAEYWIAHHLRDIDYVGLGGYRRYIFPTPQYQHYGSQALHVRASADNLRVVTSDEMLGFARQILSVYDAIVPIAASSLQSVKDQYLSCGQRADIWEAFLEGVRLALPQHAAKMAWFDLEHRPHYCGNTGFMPLAPFKDYALAYLDVVRFILSNVSDPFAVLDDSNRFRSDRWIGFLSERFFSYFLFCTKLSKFESPFVFLE